MNFKELFEAAKLVDPTDSISLNVDAWRHVHHDTTGNTSESLEWTVYSAKLGENYHGPTGEHALNAYRYAVRGKQLIPEQIEKVGEVSM